MPGATMHFTADLGRLLDPLWDQTEEWGERRRRRFLASWQALENAGAELIEVVPHHGGLAVRLSDDFISHAAAWGIGFC